MSSLKSIIPGVLAGAASAAALSFALSPAAPAAEETQAGETRVIQQSAGTDAKLSGKLSTIESRLRSLEAQKFGQPNRVATTKPEDDPVDEPTAAEVVVADLAHHTGQGVDPVWAPRAQTTFTSDFNALAKREGFEFRGADCRGDSCVITVAFDSYDKARGQLGLLAGSTYQVNCATSVAAPPPTPDATGPYELRVFMTNCIKDDA